MLVQGTMKGDFKRVARRRRSLSFMSAALVATLLPPVMLVAITHAQALQSAERTLEDAVAGAVKRTNRLLSRADAALRGFVAEARETTGQDVPRRLARLVYGDPRFREAGIIDQNGNLVVTNFGPLVPPVPVPPDQRSDPTIPELQVIGLVRTAVMEEKSVILALPVAGTGEINVLVDPQVLTAYLQDMDLGPSGFVAFTMADGRMLAAAGEPRLRNERLQLDPADQRLRREGASKGGEIRIIAEVARDWALRHWQRTFWIIAGVTLASNAVLAGLLFRHLRRSSGLDHDLRLGLQCNEFSLVYQPIVELASGRCIGAEALMRWHHPDHGAVSPDVFIPMAEASGQIQALTEWLLRTVGKELGPFLQRHPEIWISLNVPLSLFVGGQITAMLTRAFKEGRIASDQVRLEITERQIFEDDDGSIRATIAELSGLGVGVGLDDFGSGGCGMAHLLDLDLAYLKLDKTFVREIGRDSRSTIVVDTLIEMSRRLQLTVIGEGIEKPEHVQYLRNADVSLGQGWYLAQPMRAGDLPAFLAGRAA
jgi:sensor c-di-GMP phosphodiesterase-like protein